MTGVQMSMAGLEEFQARIGRIETGRGHLAGQTIFVGMDEVYHLAGAATTKRAESPLRETLSLFLSYLWAFVFGYVAFVAVLFLRNGLALRPADSAMMELGMNIIGAALISVALAQLLRLNTPRHRALQLGGIGLAVVSLHNLVHWAPDLFGTVFSPVWVGHMIAQAPANSLAIAGFALRF